MRSPSEYRDCEKLGRTTTTGFEAQAYRCESEEKYDNDTVGVKRETTKYEIVYANVLRAITIGAFGR